jgi:glycopeptide antibiotics resistance protein
MLKLQINVNIRKINAILHKLAPFLCVAFVLIVALYTTVFSATDSRTLFINGYAEEFDLFKRNFTLHELAQFSYNAGINLVVFGAFAALTMFTFKKRRILRSAVSGVALMILIEVLQFLCFSGYASIDNLVIRVIGIAAGIVVMFLLQKLYTVIMDKLDKSDNSSGQTLPERA